MYLPGEMEAYDCTEKNVTVFKCTSISEWRKTL